MQEGQLFFYADEDEENILLPTGGNPGECVIKNDDGDVVWGKIVALPEGGSDGQYLVKTGTANGAAKWKDLPIASASISGVVTTGAQTFAGNKTFTGEVGVKEKLKLYNNNISGQHAGGINQVTVLNDDGSIQYNQMQLTSASFNSGTATPNGKFDIYLLPAASKDLTATKYYDIVTTKNYSTTTDGRYLKKSGDTMTGDLTISRSTTIANNTPATLNFKVTQTDNNVTSTSYIKVYDDLDGQSYGNNMVINSKSGVYICAGECGDTYLTNNPSVAEDVHICADANIKFHTNCNTIANATNTVYIDTKGALYGAVWNDYAEYRTQKETVKPGYCVASADNGEVYKTTEKFQACDGIVSDTFGFAIGETDECKTPLAVAGRVLAYCEGDRYNYHSGDTVCAGPGGKVCKMTREEIREWPDRIVGIVSEIPEYETWGSGNIAVDGRIWIKIK